MSDRSDGQWRKRELSITSRRRSLMSRSCDSCPWHLTRGGPEVQ